MTGMTRFRYGWSPTKPLKSSGNDRVDADDAVFPTLLFYYPHFRIPTSTPTPILTRHPSHPCHNNIDFNGLGMTSWGD
jgi:hypothetical protein